jgi:hypothetical protein
MVKFITNNWKLLSATAVVGTIAYLLLRKKGDEKTSGFLGSPFGKTVQFTLTNNTNVEQQTTLFDAFTDTSNPNVGIQPINMSNSQFNRSLLSEPIKINVIEVRANASSTSTNATIQSQNVITKICKDASGTSNTEYYYPMVSPNQFQGGITTVTPNNLILDGTCYLQYSIAPHSVVTLVFRYDVTSKYVTPQATTVDTVAVKNKSTKHKKKKRFFFF